MNRSASWLADAGRLPIAFAQVREDPLLDLEVLAPCPDQARVILVASGGCTAALLAASTRLRHLHLVDFNPAQLALARLKLRLLHTTEPAQRRALLGHAPLAARHRGLLLCAELQALNLAPDALGPLDVVADLGPDHAGRYERLFARLREALQEHAVELGRVLRLADPIAQARRVGSTTDLGRALDEAYDSVLALPNLVQLFGEGATRNRVEPFARHFARRTRHALATLPAAANPWLWQMLLGRFPRRAAYPWLTVPAPERPPEVTWSASLMADALAAARGAYDLVHLSNILDWLSAEEARHTLELAWRALRPGGFVLVRQLNSTLDIPGLGGPFEWQARTAAALHGHDRSFFYRDLHLGRKA
jgi:S-adenosylmethionine-diacylglycerol 3-amino-3-carboxypropyl transferase